MGKVEFDDLPSLDEVLNSAVLLRYMPFNRGFLLLAFYIIEIIVKKLSLYFEGYYVDSSHSITKILWKVYASEFSSHLKFLSNHGLSSLKFVQGLDFVGIRYCKDYMNTDIPNKSMLLDVIDDLSLLCNKLGIS